MRKNMANIKVLKQVVESAMIPAEKSVHRISEHLYRKNTHVVTESHDPIKLVKNLIVFARKLFKS